MTTQTSFSPGAHLARSGDIDTARPGHPLPIYSTTIVDGESSRSNVTNASTHDLGSSTTTSIAKPSWGKNYPEVSLTSRNPTLPIIDKTPKTPSTSAEQMRGEPMYLMYQCLSSGGKRIDGSTSLHVPHDEMRVMVEDLKSEFVGPGSPEASTSSSQTPLKVPKKQRIPKAGRSFKAGKKRVKGARRREGLPKKAIRAPAQHLWDFSNVHSFRAGADGSLTCQVSWKDNTIKVEDLRGTEIRNICEKELIKLLGDDGWRKVEGFLCQKWEEC